MTFRTFGPQTTRIYRAAAVITILCLAGYLVANTLGLHVHVLPDGRIVVHSHPIEKSSRAQTGHHHSYDEYVTIDAKSRLLQSYDLNPAVGLVAYYPCRGWLEPTVGSDRPSAGSLTASGRSPPHPTSA